MCVKICLTNNVTKSVFVIVNCTTDRVEFDKKGIFFAFDLEMTLMSFCYDFGVIIIIN